MGGALLNSGMGELGGSKDSNFLKDFKKHVFAKL